MYLINPNQKQYKANLHCHSIHSDGKKTPEELKEMYKNEGYSILAITDHENPRSHTDLTDEEFILITGYEAYIRPNKKCSYDVYGKEVHINLFAKDPSNETYVGFDPICCKYISLEEADTKKKAGPFGAREYSVDYINRFVASAKENGYIAAYNHPWWSMENEEDMLAYEGFFSMEMCNYGSYLISGLEYNGGLYDKMLKKGKRIFCHSADDNHNSHPIDSPHSDSFGGFAMIMPENFSYNGIMDAMEKGQMYSSMGPVFKEISVEDNKVHIECSDVQKIWMFTGSKDPKREYANAGETINSADFEIDPRAQYIRISIVDNQGRFADTRGFFMDEISNK